MLPDWIGRIVGKMHVANISGRELAEHMGVTPEYISMILNGKRNPNGAEQRIESVLDEIISLPKSDT